MTDPRARHRVASAADVSAGRRPRAPLAQLVRRSRLLAATDHGACAGSCSAKLSRTDDAPGGELLWITGLGDGLVARPAADLLGLRLEALLPLLDFETAAGEELLRALAGLRLPFRLAGYAAEALAHALVPATHVDLTFPDAVMAICDASAGPRLTHECFGAAAAWVPFACDGLAFARAVGAAAAAPGVRLALLEKQGLLTWGATAEACHAATLAATERAAAFVASRGRGAPGRGRGRACAPPSERRRRAVLAHVLRVLRRELSPAAAAALEADSSPELLAFLCERDAPLLSQAGPTCPRQVPLTRRLPLWIDYDPAREDAGELTARIRSGLGRYRARARWEAAACGSSLPGATDLDPRVVLVGRIGMVAAGAGGDAARRAARAYRHAVVVMTGAAAIDRFVAPTALECAPFQPAPPAGDGL